MIYRLLCGFLVLFFSVPAALHAQTAFFWEQPEVFSPGNFPVTACNGSAGIAVWQEPVRGPGEGGSISIALAVMLPGQPWEKRGIIGGPHAYSGTEPAILSAVIDARNRILIAAAASASEIELLISNDLGQTFERRRLSSGLDSSLAPRISVASDGSYLLFVTRGREDAFSIFFSRSADGLFWAPFQPFIADPGMRLNFLPFHASFRGREYVVFQSFTGAAGGINLFQLFIKTSDDGGRTWSAPRRFTDFQSPNMNALADEFDNQRPHLSVQGNSLFLAWERRHRAGTPQIYAARLGADGALAGPPERVSSAAAHSSNPIAVHYRGQATVFWFDNRRGFNRIFMAQRAGLWWE